MRVTRFMAVTAAAVLAVAAGSLALNAQELEAQQRDERNVGTLVEIGPDSGAGVEVDVDGAGVDIDVEANADVEADGFRTRRGRRLDRRPRRPGFVEPRRVDPRAAEPRVVVSQYMIGIGGGPLPPEVRAQVDLPPTEGVLVRRVDPQGPAADAGIQQYDIITRANGDPIGTLQQLAEVVGDQGEMKSRITLELLRQGRRQTVWVTPVERPVETVNNDPRRRFGGGGIGAILGEGLREGGLLDEGLLDGELGELFQNFGLQQGQQSYMFGGPDGGVSVSVTRENDQTAQVTVRSGDQVWEFAADDADALAALPEGVRPLVERVLQGQGGGQLDLEVGPGGLRLQLGEMRRRMQQMERQADDLRRQLDEAPAFEPGVSDPETMEPELADPPELVEPGPVEVEIPADAE